MHAKMCLIEMRGNDRWARTQQKLSLMLNKCDFLSLFFPQIWSRDRPFIEKDMEATRKLMSSLAIAQTIKGNKGAPGSHTETPLCPEAVLRT